MIAITGATGFVGGNVLRLLHERNIVPRVLVHRSRHALAGMQVETVHADLTDPQSLLNAFEGVDTVIHLAAQVGSKGGGEALMRRLNIEGTQHVLDACIACDVKRLVYMSSIRVFREDRRGQIIDENCPLVDESEPTAYGRTKAEAERLVLEAAANGLDVVILNPTGIIGPYDYNGSMMQKLLIALYKQKLPALVAGGFDWVDVRDVARAILLAMENGKAGERYLIGGQWLSMSELAQTISHITGNRAPGIVIPESAAMFLGWGLSRIAHALGKEFPINHQYIRILQTYRNVNINKAKEELGYNPRPIEQTLKDTFSWYRKTGRI